MSSSARNDDFKNLAHVDYNKDIQKLAQIEGFDRRNTGLSMFRYGTQNMRTKKPKVSSWLTGYTKDGKNWMLLVE